MRNKAFGNQPLQYHRRVQTKGVTIEDPTSSEDLTLWYADQSLQILHMTAVVMGTTPSVTYTIRHGTDRSAAGTEVKTSGSAVSSTTSGTSVSLFDAPNVRDGSWIWIETTATSGSVTQFHVTIYYR